MEWVPITGYENGIDLADRPRRLTEEEIVYIASYIPTPPSADPLAAELSREGIVEWLVETLKGVEIAPSAIPELIETIVERHHKSLVAPGTPVGITAAEAIGATTTQATLNSVAPWEKILLWSRDEISKQMTPMLTEIGPWIDALIQNRSEKVQHIPENRTQYLEIDPIFILSPDATGKMILSNITAVTKHLPIGDLVKITTQTGRSATVTQSKSLLVWDGDKLIQKGGDAVKVGDQVPVVYSMDPLVPRQFPHYPLHFKEGQHVANLWNRATIVEEYVKAEDFNLLLQFNPNEPMVMNFLLAPIEFLRGFMNRIKPERIPPHHLEYLTIISNSLEDRHGDVFLDPIVSVEMVPASEFVYDLTVPATTNFSLWNGLGVADTFHTSGSAKSVTSGIEAIRDVIFARKTLKHETSTIYFTDKSATYEQILDKRKDIVGSVVWDFVKDYDIDGPQVLSRFWWHAAALIKRPVPHSAKVLRLFLDTNEMYKHRVSIAQLAAVLEREVPPSVVTVYGPISDGIIDLYPDPSLVEQTLSKAAISSITPELTELVYLESIVIPDLKNIRVKGISGIRQIYPVAQPVWSMVILERKLVESDITNETNRPVLEPHLGSGWILYCNPVVMKSTGLLVQNLAALCQRAGLELIAEIPDMSIIVGLPNDRWRTNDGLVVIQRGPYKWARLASTDFFKEDQRVYRQIVLVDVNGQPFERVEDRVNIPVDPELLRTVKGTTYKQLHPDDYAEEGELVYQRLDAIITIKELKPSEYVVDKIGTDKQWVKRETERLTKLNYEEAQRLPEDERKIFLRKPVIVPRTDLMKASEFIIATAEGSNLKELLALPGIDKRRTTCNNMYTITEALGIEAARSFLIRSLTEIIANSGSYIHPANILLVAEFITSRGEPYGATYTGISRTSDYLSLATLERAAKVFTMNALHGRKADVRNVSASVAVGARMAIGSGAFDIAQDIMVNGVLMTVINDDLFTALARDDESQALLALQMAADQQETITPDQLQAGLEGLKSLRLGGSTFDFTGEDDTNLISIFNPENFPETSGVAPIAQAVPVKPVRRVQARPQPETSSTFVAPADLIDVISQMKIGTPLENAIQGSVRPAEDVPIVQPIISSGLIPLSELAQPFDTHGEGDIQTDINDFLARYLREAAPDILEVGPVTVVSELPRATIATLPDLTGLNPARDLIALRREQVRDLIPPE